MLTTQLSKRSAARSVLAVAFAAAMTFVFAPAAASAQPTLGSAPNAPKGVIKPKASPTPAPPAKLDPKNLTAEQVAEVSILAYGVRDRLNQIRKTTTEAGTTTYTRPTGVVEQAKYQRFVVRGDDLAKEKIRLDQQFSGARYSLLYKDAGVVGLYDNSTFAPREDVSKSFENQIIHGLEALLRYKENGSAVAISSRDKIMGVEYILLDVTDKQQRKTTFYVSAKTYRVMMLSYEDAGVRYRRKFYDYNYAQGTLVPYRTVLWADDKQVEESEIGTVTFGQKLDEGMFTVG